MRLLKIKSSLHSIRLWISSQESTSASSAHRSSTKHVHWGKNKFNNNFFFLGAISAEYIRMNHKSWRVRKYQSWSSRLARPGNRSWTKASRMSSLNDFLKSKNHNKDNFSFHIYAGIRFRISNYFSLVNLISLLIY